VYQNGVWRTINFGGGSPFGGFGGFGGFGDPRQAVEVAGVSMSLPESFDIMEQIGSNVRLLHSFYLFIA
jgi:hypothetical protein